MKRERSFIGEGVRQDIEFACEGDGFLVEKGYIRFGRSRIDGHRLTGLRRDRAGIRDIG